MQTQISQEEASALAQVLDTYEHIAQSQPDDYQSIEALKDAYLRLGRKDDALRASKMLVNAYCAHGQYSMALMECEGILQQEPGSAEVLAVMAELEKRTGGRLHADPAPDPMGSLIATQGTRLGTPGQASGANGSASSGGLIVTAATQGAKGVPRAHDLGMQGNQAFAAFIANQGLAPRAVVQQALESLPSKAAPNAPAPSLLLEISRMGGIPLENLLSDLVDLTGISYIPIEAYDVDRNVVQLLPDDLTLGRLMLPFDQIGRVVYLAVCNPFDAEARQRAQQSLEYHIEWFLASPDHVQNRLAQVYRLPQPNP